MNPVLGETTEHSRKTRTSAHALFRKFPPVALAIYLIAGIVFSGLVQRAGFESLLEVGYGDSYVFYDVQNLEKTGTIYRDLSKPPYLAAQYSPLVYWTYSVSRFSPSYNIFLGPRIIAFVLFMFCLGTVVSIVKELIPVPLAWVWGILFAASIRSMDVWVLQLRGDFLGIFFALLSIRLLLSRNRYAGLAAGLCAGMAIQVKLTLMAAAVAGLLWLLVRKRWKELGFFAFGAVATSFGLFFIYWLREPMMLSQMTVVLPGIKDLRGCFRLFLVAIGEPVFLFSLAAAPLIARKLWPVSKQWPRWTLLLIYVLASTGLSFAADIQAGGNINYFFEALFGLIPFAVLGALQLFSWSCRFAPAALFLAGIFLVQLPLSDLRALSKHNKSEYDVAEVNTKNQQFIDLQEALRGRRILSLDPRAALIDPEPPLMEPFLLSYLRRLGRFNPSVLLGRIRRGDFDVFISCAPVDREVRGIRKFEGNDLERAVAEAYQPYCEILGDLVELPQRKPDAALEQKLRTVGCVVSGTQKPAM